MSEQKLEVDGRRRTWLWVAAAVVAVIVVLVVVLLVNRSDGDDPTVADSATSTAASPSKSSPPEPEESASEPDATPSQEPSDEAPAEPGPTATADIGSDSEVAPGVTARVGNIESITGEAVQPGEVSGPALRVTVELSNGTDAAASLSGVVVNLYYGADSTPANPLSLPGASPFAGSLEAGATAAGTFVFSVPSDERDHIKVEVDAQLGGPVVVFEGPTPS